MKDHLFLISYNRPTLLKRTLSALAAQSVRQWQITLCQDGPIDARDSNEKSAIRECVEAFRSTFPGGEIIESPRNLGIGLNIQAAQQRAFRHHNLEVAFFFEDDLVPHASYMEQMLALRDVLAAHRQSCPYFACYGRTHAFSPRMEQIPGSSLRFMDHFWGYGLFRQHWEDEQEVLQPYFSYLQTTPYLNRSHQVIRSIFRRIGHPQFATSQDSARIVALLQLGRCGVATLPQRATYIGREGTHSTEPAYERWGFRPGPLPDHLEIVFPEISPQALADACSAFPRWVRTMQAMPPNQIDFLEQSLSDSRDETAEMDARITAMENEITAMGTEICARDSEIAGKDAEIHEMAKEVVDLTEQLRAIRESTFWRATSPLRHVLDKARAARRRLFRRATAPLLPCADTVAIDITTIWHHDAGTGIQRVVRRLARELAGTPRAGKRIVLVDYSSGIPRDVTKPFLTGAGDAANASAVTEMSMLIMLDSSYNLAPSFSRHLREAKEKGVYVVSICHDLLPVAHPEWFLAVNHIPFRRWIHLAVEYSNAFLCVSDTTAARLSEFVIERRRTLDLQIASWPLGHDMDNVPVRPGNKVRDYALMVGTVEPRKNHLFVLEALGQLRDSGKSPPHLVVVGRDGWKNKPTVRLLREGEKEGWVTWHGQGLPDGQLAQLYAQAKCVIQASHDEGFGLPIAEAAAFGKPVVLSDIPVFREIVSENGYFFRLGDAKSFTDALTSACRPNAKPTSTKAVSWQESADIFWRRCLELREAETARRTT